MWIWRWEGIAKRTLLKIFSLISINELVSGISWKTPSLISEVLSAWTQDETHESHTEHAEASHGPTSIDTAGTLWFILWVKALLEWKHIDEKHYSWLALLLYGKYLEASPEEKKHLVDELYSSLKAFWIIAWTVALTEWLSMNLERTYSAITQKELQEEDSIALLAMFSSVMSPLVTTVWNANIIKNIANEIADGDKDIMALFVGHNSGRSGYLLFWDPPFVAVVEKYGFKEGITWQMETMWPLAMYSLFSSMYKTHYIKRKKIENTKSAHAYALKATIIGMKNNLPVLVQIITQSLLNTLKYYGFQEQTKKWIETAIWEQLWVLTTNLARLPWDKKFDTSSHEVFEGRTTGDKGHELRKMAHDLAESIQKNAKDDDIRIKHQIEDAFVTGNTKTLLKILKKYGVNYNPILRDFFELSLKKEEETIEDTPIDTVKRNTLSSFTSLVSPKSIYNNTFDLDRIKESLGHNLADIINVFPFQAGSVPFLIPMLQQWLKELEEKGMNQTTKEQVIFFSLMMFSMFADNYVACKIGLEILPEKPHIPFIAAIEWGELTTIGNMANVTQFSLEDYSLADSLNRVWLSTDNIAVAWGHAFFLVGNIFWKDILGKQKH